MYLIDLIQLLLNRNSLIHLSIEPNWIQIKISLTDKHLAHSCRVMPYYITHNGERYQYRDNNTVYITSTNTESILQTTKEFIYVKT